MYDYIKRRDEDGRPTRRSKAPPQAIVRRVESRRVLDWLATGARDIGACRGRSLVFGLCYVAAGYAIVQAHERDAAWLEGMVAGFLFLGPLLAVGTYELSRQRERGERADLIVALFAWCRNPRGLCLHAVLLGAVLMLWLQLSWVLLDRAAPSTDTAFASTSLLWWLAWIAFAVVAFVSGVVAVPLLLDRPVGVLSAVRTSVDTCLGNPPTMALWAVTIAALVGVSLRAGFWPLLLVGPWIGHATWHVYRDCVSTATPTPVAPDVP